MKIAETAEYFKILSADFPKWLREYINTSELQTQKYISVTCGTLYSDLFDSDVFYSDKKESDIIRAIENSKYKDVWDAWRKAKKVNVSKTRPSKDIYYVRQKVKVRYIDPLCNGERMSKICKIAKNAIDKNLAYDMDSYVYLDFKLEK